MTCRTETNPGISQVPTPTGLLLTYTPTVIKSLIYVPDCLLQTSSMTAVFSLGMTLIARPHRKAHSVAPARWLPTFTTWIPLSKS